MAKILVRLILFFVLFAPLPAAAQTNVCDLAAAAKTLPFVAGAMSVGMISPDHATNDPSGQPIVVDYLGEVLVVGTTTPVTNWTIPKASLAPQTGTPSNCYLTPIPSLAPLPVKDASGNTILYTVRVSARNAAGAAPSAASADRFFYRAAPTVPAAPRLQSP